MDTGLQGKAAFVGGGSKGIGRAIAFGLAREGCAVAICARNLGPLEETAAAIRADAPGAKVHTIVCDMARHDDIKKAVAAAQREFGRLDIIVNNAGGPPTGTFETLDERYWEHAIEQNLLSAVRTTREALPFLRASGSGRIINVTSVAVKQPIDGLMLSNATRLGVIGMAKTLSREVAATGITVNNVCPGNIATDRLMSIMEANAQTRGGSFEDAVAAQEATIPAGYFGDPEDIANLVVFLASDKARYITGTTIQVDGGSTTAVF
jgi:3-oxoacyl-[acyl-carrier protein] reductase